MNKIATTICLGLGDNLIARMLFDTVKHNYNEITISHSKPIMQIYKNGDIKYANFLNDIGNLLFTEYPYKFDHGSHPDIHTLNTIQKFSPIIKPNLQYLLCTGNSLNINDQYVCITTKIRMLPKKSFLTKSIYLWKTLAELSNKYKIVIIGERELNESTKYMNDLSFNLVYSIYDNIISNIPSENIIDLTIPSLGLIAPTLSKIQQDSLIMKEAKAVISFGDGGNFWHAVASADKVIAYREDNDTAADSILSPNFTHVSMHKNWDNFIQELAGF